MDSISESVERSWTHNLPFGDWRYIRHRLVDGIGRRLGLSQRLFPQATPAAELLQKLDETTARRLLEHPFLRALVFSATMNLKYEWKVVTREQVARFYEQLGALLEDGWRGEQLSSLSLLMEEQHEDAPRHNIWQWTGTQDDRTFTGITPTVLLKTNPICAFRSPSADESKNLRWGFELLRELLPVLTPNLLRHIDVIALITSGQPSSTDALFPAGGAPPPDAYTSFTSDTSPGVVFISPSVLSNPWYTAEIILHEGLHSKLYDVMVTHNLFRPDYTKQDAAQLHPLWHVGSEPWDVRRALFAMHVYAHLGLFFQRATTRFEELAPRFGALHVMDPRLAMRRSFDRARFLGMKIAEAGTQDLGAAGHHLLEQLQQMLELLDRDSSEATLSQRIVEELHGRQTLALERFFTHWRTLPPASQVTDVAALITALAQVDAALLGQDSPAHLPPVAMDAPGLDARARSLIALRKQLPQLLTRGENPIDINTFIDSATRSGHLLRQARIRVELNP